MFCYQKNFSNPTLPVDEAQFYALVRAKQWNENIDKYRKTGEASLKRKLPAFIFQATFEFLFNDQPHLRADPSAVVLDFPVLTRSAPLLHTNIMIIHYCLHISPPINCRPFSVHTRLDLNWRRPSSP